MKYTRWLVAIGGAALIMAAFAPTSSAQKGKKPPKEPEPQYRLEMTIDDGHRQSFGYGLGSDLLVRFWDGTSAIPDIDGDGYVDFSAVPFTNALYRDRNLPGVPDVQHPDPCVGTQLADGGGAALVDLDRGESDVSWKNCIETVPDHADDGRTVGLTFNKMEPAGACVCDTFRFLADAPDPGWGAPTYRTGFSETSLPGATSGTCTVTPYADGRLLTNWVQAQSANVRVNTHLWDTIKSIDEDLEINGSGDALTVTAGNQLFELLVPSNDPAAGCSGFTFPAKVTFERTDVSQQ